MISPEVERDLRRQAAAEVVLDWWIQPLVRIIDHKVYHRCGSRWSIAHDICPQERTTR